MVVFLAASDFSSIEGDFFLLDVLVVISPSLFQIIDRLFLPLSRIKYFFSKPILLIDLHSQPFFFSLQVDAAVFACSSCLIDNKSVLSAVQAE